MWIASGALIHRDDATSNVKTDYIRTAGKTIARIKGNTVSYMHQDHLGSSVASTTAAGGIAWREDFTPYGEKRLDPNANKDDDGLVTVWFRSLAYHYATLASKAKGLIPPRYEWRLRAL